MLFLYSAIPMFAHVLQRWRKIYVGLCIGGGFRTVFEISHLRHGPTQCRHLAGLLEIFKDKLVGQLVNIGWKFDSPFQTQEEVYSETHPFCSQRTQSSFFAPAFWQGEKKDGFLQAIPFEIQINLIQSKYKTYTVFQFKQQTSMFLLRTYWLIVMCYRACSNK